jgi:hypothetical protein
MILERDFRFPIGTRIKATRYNPYRVVTASVTAHTKEGVLYRADEDQVFDLLAGRERITYREGEIFSRGHYHHEWTPL